MISVWSYWPTNGISKRRRNMGSPMETIQELNLQVLCIFNIRNKVSFQHVRQWWRCLDTLLLLHQAIKDLDSVAVVAQTKLCLKHLSVSWCQISMSSLQELPNFKVDSPLGKSHNTLCKMHIQLWLWQDALMGIPRYIKARRPFCIWNWDKNAIEGEIPQYYNCNICHPFSGQDRFQFINVQRIV